LLLQCSTTHEGETFSSIGYFLNVKPTSTEDDNYEDLPFNSTADYEDLKTHPANVSDNPLLSHERKLPFQSGRVLFQETPFAKTDLVNEKNLTNWEYF